MTNALAVIAGVALGFVSAWARHERRWPTVWLTLIAILANLFLLARIGESREMFVFGYAAVGAQILVATVLWWRASVSKPREKVGSERDGG